MRTCIQQWIVPTCADIVQALGSHNIRLGARHQLLADGKGSGQAVELHHAVQRHWVGEGQDRIYAPPPAPAPLSTPWIRLP